MPTPKPDINGIKTFLNYRRQGLSYREISKMMNKDLKTLYRWANYPVGKLSTLELIAE